MNDYLDRTYFEQVRKAQAKGRPVARYRKAVLGNVAVRMIDVFSGKPVDIILHHDPTDKGVIEDDYTVTLWTDMEHEYFRKANKTLLEGGFLSQYEGSVESIEETANEISDDEIRDVLGKPYFTLMNLLSEVTSPNTALRILHIAEELDRPVRTIEKIKERTAELQKTYEEN